jgi:TolB protein
MFSAYNGLHVIEPSTGRDRILSDAPGDSWSDITWSPLGFDDFKLAYVYGLTIYIVRADGRGSTELRTGTAGFDSSPSWSPDGTRIAYASRSGHTSSVYTIGIDGSRRRLLARNASSPAWSPDGTTISYRGGCGIRLITPSGRNMTPLSPRRCLAIGLTGDPVWSPDGKKIAFAHVSTNESFAGSGTYVMNRDGSHLLRLSKETGLGVFRHGRPAWRPVFARRPQSRGA